MLHVYTGIHNFFKPIMKVVMHDGQYKIIDIGQQFLCVGTFDSNNNGPLYFNV